jgi:hypothetical protein
MDRNKNITKSYNAINPLVNPSPKQIGSPPSPSPNSLPHSLTISPLTITMKTSLFIDLSLLIASLGVLIASLTVSFWVFSQLGNKQQSGGSTPSEFDTTQFLELITLLKSTNARIFELTTLVGFVQKNVSNDNTKEILNGLISVQDKSKDSKNLLEKIAEKLENVSKEDLSQLIKLTNTISSEISKLSNLPADVSETLKDLTNSVSELSQKLETVPPLEKPLETNPPPQVTTSTKYDDLTCPFLDNYFNSYDSLKDKIFVEPTEESLNKYQQNVTHLILQQSIASTPSSKQFLLIPHPEKFQGDDLYWLLIEPQLRLDGTNILQIRYFFRYKNQPKKYISEDEQGKTCKLSEPALVVEISGHPKQWKLIKTGLMEMVR